jgi:hypothetical protein
MSNIKQLNQAISTIAQFFHEPSDNEAGNRFATLQDRMLFSICDTLAGNVQWVMNTGLPNTQRTYDRLCRENRGGEIDLISIAEKEDQLNAMKDQLMLADAALDAASAVYTKHTGKDYAWVPYADRNKGTVKSSTNDAANAALAAMRAKYGVKA